MAMSVQIQALLKLISNRSSVSYTIRSSIMKMQPNLTTKLLTVYYAFFSQCVDLMMEVQDDEEPGPSAGPSSSKGTRINRDKPTSKDKEDGQAFVYFVNSFI